MSGAASSSRRRRCYWKIQFPSALPTIFIGFKLGLIFALINVVGVEFLINFGGLGQLINDLAERYDLPGTYAAICFVILVSVIFFIVTERIERWLTTGRLTIRRNGAPASSPVTLLRVGDHRVDRSPIWEALAASGLLYPRRRAVAARDRQARSGADCCVNRANITGISALDRRRDRHGAR